MVNDISILLWRWTCSQGPCETSPRLPGSKVRTLKATVLEYSKEHSWVMLDEITKVNMYLTQNSCALSHQHWSKNSTHHCLSLCIRPKHLADLLQASSPPVRQTSVDNSSQGRLNNMWQTALSNLLHVLDGGCLQQLQTRNNQVSLVSATPSNWWSPYLECLSPIKQLSGVSMQHESHSHRLVMNIYEPV